MLSIAVSGALSLGMIGMPAMAIAVEDNQAEKTESTNTGNTGAETQGNSVENEAAEGTQGTDNAAGQTGESGSEGSTGASGENSEGGDTTQTNTDEPAGKTEGEGSGEGSGEGAGKGESGSSSTGEQTEDSSGEAAEIVLDYADFEFTDDEISALETIGSNAVVQVIGTVKALPLAEEVTADHKTAIDDAKALYDALAEEELDGILASEVLVVYKEKLDADIDALDRIAKEEAEKKAESDAAKKDEAAKSDEAAKVTQSEAKADTKKETKSEGKKGLKSATALTNATTAESQDANSNSENLDGNVTTEQDSSFDSLFESENVSRVWYHKDLTTEMFIASIGEQARQIGQKENLYASVMIAQAILESASGNSGLAQAPNNNLFGIKGSYKGQSVNMLTSEDDGFGNKFDIHSDFRRYDTVRESLDDYAKLLRNDPYHYSRAWKENASTYESAAKALQGTYATSTSYAMSLCGLIETYDLTRFDKPAEYTIQGKIYDPDSKKADKKGYRELTMDDYVALESNAISFMGTPYKWGGTDPDGFDCSGFVQYLYKQTFDIDLSRTTYSQQHEGKEVKFDDLQMGDLLFFKEGKGTEHVAMYLSDGFFIHAPETGDVIKITDMDSFKPTFAKRILDLKKTSKVKAAK